MTENDVLAEAIAAATLIIFTRVWLTHRRAVKTADRKAAKENPS